jgi:hypothetical protein
VVPDHDLPPEIRFLLLQRGDHAGTLSLNRFPVSCLISLQLLILVLKTKSAEFAVTIAAIPIVLFLLAGCGLAVAHEIKWQASQLRFRALDAQYECRLMTASLALMLAALSYCKDNTIGK